MPATPKPEVAAAGEATVAFRLRLLVHDLDLFVDHLPGETVDRDVHPITLFPLNNESIR
jgi:hypothetical protein